MKIQTQVSSFKFQVSSYFKKLFTVHCSLFTAKKGFTLIELVMTMVLIGIIAYIVAIALSTGIKAYFTTDFRKEALDQSRIAMERITREIRNVRSLGTSVDADGFIDAEIGTANATQFCFNDVSGNTISFRYDGSNNIYREEWTPANLAACPSAGGGNILAENVTALNFQYVLANGTITQTPDTLPALQDRTDIRRVQIGWSGTPGISINFRNETVSLTSEVYLRNLQ
ncbi:MAG: type II secretion system protein [Thermodesulfovibrionales bacterium]|nr:type II secretion system protein [Candidatus Omnitrophota bacterium]